MRRLCHANSKYKLFQNHTSENHIIFFWYCHTVCLQINGISDKWESDRFLAQNWLLFCSQINGNSDKWEFGVKKKTETWQKWSDRNKENVKIPNSRNRLENKSEVLVLSFSVLLNTLDRKTTSKRSASGNLRENN